MLACAPDGSGPRGLGGARKPDLLEAGTDTDRPRGRGALWRRRRRSAAGRGRRRRTTGSGSSARARICFATLAISWDGASPTTGCASCCLATSRRSWVRTSRPSCRTSSATPGYPSPTSRITSCIRVVAKVMSTYRSAFGLSDEALSIARECMRTFGNLSSAAVLVMLSNLVASGAPRSRRYRPDAGAGSGIRRGDAGARVVADVAIAGGGPAGAALAIELGRRGRPRHALREGAASAPQGVRRRACSRTALPRSATSPDCRTRPAFAA